MTTRTDSADQPVPETAVDPLTGRVDGLDRAVDAAGGRIDAGVLAEAAAVVARARDRLRLSGEHTVVALAGSTGSGKSSLFNGLTELDLAAVGVRRPTTSWALACAWGPSGAAEVLEWIGVPERHQVSHASLLDTEDESSLRGLVLLDLPDHDSTEVAHHLEVERLVTHADLMVWVLDPQKYADAAVHERYLRPLAPDAGVMLVVLNQIDTIPAADRERALQDVRRLLDEDGLADVPLLGTSAVTRDGLGDLREALVTRIGEKAAAAERLNAEVSGAATRLAAVSGTTPAVGVTEATQREFEDRLAGFCGVEVVADAVERETVQQGATWTGWLPARWLGRRPAARSHRLARGPSVTAVARSSVPEPTKVQRAGADSAVRDLAQEASRGLEEPWVASVRSASLARGADLAETLDQAVTETDLQVSRRPGWWPLMYVLQWLFLVVALVGLGWVLVQVVGSVVGDAPDVPAFGFVTLPVLLLVCGTLVGIVLAEVSLVLVRSSARRRAQHVREVLRTVVGRVAQDEVVRPVREELERYETCRAGLEAALASPRDRHPNP